jgi:hypothetical protein
VEGSIRFLVDRSFCVEGQWWRGEPFARQSTRQANDSDRIIERDTEQDRESNDNPLDFVCTIPIVEDRNQ